VDFINILVLNSGSSSLKYQLIDMKSEKVLAKGMCEKIGFNDSEVHQWIQNSETISKSVGNIKNHKEAFVYIEKMLMDKNAGVIKDISEIWAVGHRVVHGGEYFKYPALINDEVIEEIKSLIPLAPLHNAAHLAGIEACRFLLGDSVPQVAVFDTSFYFDIEEKAYMFPIPYEYYEKYHIRKYGFHGTSHKFVSERYCEISGKKFSNTKIISCHMGNGSSITAVKGGKAVDTSMGLSPLGGIMMGTRSGSLDPSVILHIAERESLEISEINDILNKKSGMLGISGVSSDDRAILKAAQEGNKRAKLAHEMMIYQITNYLGAYNAILQGCNAVIFTGGIGENQWMHREKICNNLKFMGVKIDSELNKSMVAGKEGKISSENSSIDVYVIPTNEELAIARDTLTLLSNMQRR